MPDLSYLNPLIPGLMTAVMGFNGELLTDKERKYVRVFVRLTEKAIDEYKATREYVIAQVEEKQRSAEEMQREGRKLYILNIVNHAENCLNAARRLFYLLDSVKSESGGLSIDRSLRKRIETHSKKIKNIRGAVEHVEKEIQRGETADPVMLMLSDDDESIVIAGYSLRFEDLARLLERFHELARQWLGDFCRKAA